MPGKYIDRIVLTVLCCIASYLLFLNLWGSIPLACLAAFLLCAVLRRLPGKTPTPFRCTAVQAEAEILRIAAMNDSEAHTAIDSLVKKKYSSEDFVLATLVKHPTSGISIGDIFALWKKHRNTDRLLVAATCSADPRAIMYARELSEPRVAVIDRRQLLRIIRINGVPEHAASVPFLTRLRRIPKNLTLRYAGIKNGLFGLMLTAMYFITGKVLYLILGLFSLFLFGCTLPGKRYRKKLFP